MARASLLFFIISAIGPFIVGILAANGLKQSNWYQLAVYYYLHFQYNGVFTFGVLALFFHLLKTKAIPFQLNQARKFGSLLFISCFPAYALSTLWTNPPLIINGIGFVAAVGQIAAFYYFLKSIDIKRKVDNLSFSKSSGILLGSAFISFGIKLVLQLISAFPYVAALSYEIRFYVIAYLHLVLIGIISFFLIAWYNECKILKVRKSYAYILVIGFITSELVMISVSLIREDINIFKWLAIISLFLVVGIGGIIFESLLQYIIHTFIKRLG
ncbi:MAG: hypothetical protein QY309_05465 [Cyclobacteriaceae bacterium]|nr:MAG: hypothetical protein QY309_05465 [Cyclobacteriaceae bacterium]